MPRIILRFIPGGNSWQAITAVLNLASASSTAARASLCSGDLTISPVISSSGDILLHSKLRFLFRLSTTTTNAQSAQAVIEPIVYNRKAVRSRDKNGRRDSETASTE